MMFSPIDDAHRQSYEQMPYESVPFFETHPERLATIAHLAGLDAPPPGDCRVLELGCSTGGNLISAAETLPGASFLGIDLIPSQIAVGREVIDAISLKNIRLESMDLLDMPADFGQFDYIIGHGLYTWVSPHVQKRIMEICRDHLSPGGVVYLSYNTFPGWRIRSAIRDMLLYASSEAKEGASMSDRLGALRSISKTISTVAGDIPSDYSRIIRGEIDLIQKSPDSYLAHDHLEEHLHPVYFHEFTEQAAAHGLAYVADAKFSKAVYRIQDLLKREHPEITRDYLRFEQYADFAYGRQFRRSLLCHASQPIRREFDARRLQDCYLTTTVFPREKVDLRAGVSVTFYNPDDGGTFTATDTGTKAAIALLAEVFPMPLRYDDLWEKVRQVLRLPRIHPACDEMAKVLLTLFESDSIEPHLMPPAFVTTVSERPSASPLARWQAARGASVYNRQNRVIPAMSDFDRLVLASLDGTRTRQSMEDANLESVKRLAANALLIS